ncbi:hypothetical protein EZJ49_14905 [Bdellovibrio bacteriovorus]|uniref:hypothetical protein n=1 Tax=Bdellovibrio bacteriovorus TaxID=959 RepID=UPI0021CEB3EC|nr:hypothetical protein [Bdellovibrio bacteriovorus]UXR64356.1 hypothetical protein EZJ49_14905 [Bdellovibrio bacteriovorus]
MAMRTALLISTVLMGLVLSPVGARAQAVVGPTVSQIREIIGNDSKVLILADTNHNSPELRDTLGLKLSTLKAADGRFDCLFLEEDRRMQPAVDRYFQDGRVGFDAVLSYKASLLKRDLGSMYYPGSEKHMSLTAGLMQKAKEAGIQIIAADLDFSGPLGKLSQKLQRQMAESDSRDLLLKGDDIILSERNRQFAQVIKAYGGRCQRSLIYIGLAHLQEKSHKPVISLSQAIYEATGLESNMASVEQYDCSQPAKTALKKLNCLQSARLIKVAYEQTGLDFLAPLQFVLTGEDINP